MSNYTKSTNFTAKDSLPTGDTNKVIRGSEFDTEFNAISTAISTKSDLASPTFTGTATFANVSVSGTITATTIDLNGGALDGVTIGGSTPGAGTFSSLVATTADINAGTVDNTVIGGSTPAAGTFSSLTATTANIDGGNIDGTVIGASSTAAISGTTGTFSGAVTGSNLNVSNWDTAYGWGNHATQGYLTSVAFSDINGAAVITSSETFVSNDTTLPTTATLTARILAASLGPTASLDDLNDVDLTTSAPTDGEVLVYNASTSNFIPGSAGSVDGGFANSVYVTGQTINGGTA